MGIRCRERALGIKRQSRAASRLALAVWPWLASVALAHPIPNENHDRTILARVTPAGLVIDYRLEVDEARAARDLPREELAGIASRTDFYDRYCRYCADVLADNLIVTLDGKSLPLRAVARSYQLTDHLRCDFRFEASWNLPADSEHVLTLREGNYELDDFSRLWLLVVAGDGTRLLEIEAPTEAEYTRPSDERRPGDAEKLRRATVRFTLTEILARGIDRPSLPPDLDDARRPPRSGYASALDKPSEQQPRIAWKSPPTDEPPGDTELSSHNLLHLLLDTRQGLLVLLLLAGAFGAAHALTPGHGKTLVAAYLIGERGTVWHALLLGVVVTVTHTAAVLVIAALLPIYFAETPPAAVQSTLGLVGGLLITGLGFWLLLARLAGRPDHVHLGAGHDHHHHHEHPVEIRSAPGAWGLVLLGISGGIVPCWDAIAMLGLAISAQRLWLGLPLLLAFSAGLASVLIALGIGVVHARNLASERFDRWQPVLRTLPIFSAIVVMGLGFWLCLESVRSMP